MEQNQTIDLKTKSIVELKAIAYDLGIMVNEYRNMLNIVNQEIIDRGKVATPEEVSNSEGEKDTKSNGKLKKVN